MHNDTLVFSIFLIYTGAACMATLMLFTRQSLLVAYILLGILLGPWGLRLVDDPGLINHIGEFGIVFLLFLLGLHLHPKDLLQVLHKTTVVCLISSLIFALVGFCLARLFNFSMAESAIIGAAMIFSSTIIALKLAPNNILHQHRVGELMIGILLLQDFLAIFLLMVVHITVSAAAHWYKLILIILALPSLLYLIIWLARNMLFRLVARFHQVQEYIFLLAIGWCLGVAQLAKLVGLTEGVGAFLAGIVLATSPIAKPIAESLKPLRDFFLVLFFFAIGASFNWFYFSEVIFPAATLAGLMMLLKPWLFKHLLITIGEKSTVAKEIGIRLGQASEFSLLLSYVAINSTPSLINLRASYVIQATTIISFIISCYWVVVRYPTPVAAVQHKDK